MLKPFSVIGALVLTASAVMADPQQTLVDHLTPDSTVPARGIVRAIDQAELSTDLAARVAKIGFREGEAFKAGDLLIAFDCERYRAEAQSAEAVWREMKVTLDSNQHLEKFRAVGKADVEISKARVSKAEAETRSLQSRVAQCEITAPFDGRVAALLVNAHEQPQAGKPFMTIVGVGRLEIELIAPSQWLSWMKPGQDFEFFVDETKQIYSAKIARLGASVEAVSQMVKVIAVFSTAGADVLPGMSGEARFNQPGG
jgi:membrane fusion protein, multidrug efflux system